MNFSGTCILATHFITSPGLGLAAGNLSPCPSLVTGGAVLTPVPGAICLFSFVSSMKKINTGLGAGTSLAEGLWSWQEGGIGAQRALVPELARTGTLPGCLWRTPIWVQQAEGGRTQLFPYPQPGCGGGSVRGVDAEQRRRGGGHCALQAWSNGRLSSPRVCGARGPWACALPVWALLAFLDRGHVSCLCPSSPRRVPPASVHIFLSSS